MHIRFSFHQNQNEREDQEVTLAEQQRENYFIDFSAFFAIGKCLQLGKLFSY
jgi:hypothetical protein